MKKIIGAGILCLVFVLCACGSKNNTSIETETANESVTASDMTVSAETSAETQAETEMDTAESSDGIVNPFDGEEMTEIIMGDSEELAPKMKIKLPMNSVVNANWHYNAFSPNDDQYQYSGTLDDAIKQGILTEGVFDGKIYPDEILFLNGPGAGLWIHFYYTETEEEDFESIKESTHIDYIEGSGEMRNAASLFTANKKLFYRCLVSEHELFCANWEKHGYYGNTDWSTEDFLNFCNSLIVEAY